MEEIKRKYGIWGGRFQIIHKGHEYIAQYVSDNYEIVCIAIVNPDPVSPKWTSFERFNPQKNPFTYFQRAFLWNRVLKNLNVNRAVIVPCWHPRKSLQLEATFLPRKEDREWVVPDIGEEEYKIDDLKTIVKEAVNVIDILSNEMETLHASKIRRFYEEYRCFIPESIRHETEIMLQNADQGIIGETSEDFIIVPITQELIHPLLIGAGIQKSIDEGKQLVFAPVVNVKDCDDWFKLNCADNGFFSFFEKYSIINRIMEHISYFDYLVSPILVKGGKCIALDAFLPPRCAWLFLSRINTNPMLFRDCCGEYQSVAVSDLNLSGDLVLDIYSYRSLLLNEKGYYSYLRDRILN